MNGFTYNLLPAVPAPAIESISVQEVALVGGAKFTLKGKNLLYGTKVKLKDTDVPVTFISSTQLDIKTLVWPAPETVNLTLENPDGQVATVVGGIKFITALGKPPVITSVTPNTAVNTGGDLLTISGVNFNTNSKVYINNLEALTTLYTPTDLKARVPASTALGAVDIKVINSNDGQFAVVAGGFTYTASVPKPSPTITSISPNSGAKSGGYIINVNGTNFTSTSKVYVNGILALSTFYNPTLILIRVPASTVTGPVDIKVENSDGQQVVLTGGFTFN